MTTLYSHDLQQTFSNVHQFWGNLSSLPANERLEVAQHVIVNVYNNIQGNADLLTDLLDKIQGDEDLKQQYHGLLHEFMVNHADLIEFVQLHKKKRDRKQQALSYIHHHLGDEHDAWKWLQSLTEPSKTFLEAFRKLLIGVRGSGAPETWAPIQDHINLALYRRLKRRSRGSRLSYLIQPKDLHDALASLLPEDDLQSSKLTYQQMVEENLKFDRWGFLTGGQLNQTPSEFSTDVHQLRSVDAGNPDPSSDPLSPSADVPHVLDISSSHHPTGSIPADEAKLDAHETPPASARSHTQHDTRAYDDDTLCAANESVPTDDENWSHVVYPRPGTKSPRGVRSEMHTVLPSPQSNMPNNSLTQPTPSRRSMEGICTSLPTSHDDASDRLSVHPSSASDALTTHDDSDDSFVLSTSRRHPLHPQSSSPLHTRLGVASELGGGSPSPSEARRSGTDLSYQPESHSAMSQDSDVPGPTAEDDEPHAVPRRCKCERRPPSLGNFIRHKSVEDLDCATAKLMQRLLSFFPFCSFHLRGIAKRIGLRTNAVTDPVLMQRLSDVCANRFSLLKLKTDPDKLNWWLRNARPWNAKDSLGSYRIPRQDQGELRPRPDRLLDVVARLLDMDAVYINAEFERVGSANLPIFSWWFKDKELEHIINTEFELYKFHLTELDGRSNLGWSRIQYYSLTQQLMRQDPLYWMAYVALRPDHAWRLVSYPYYTKYATQADGISTEFLHLDGNPRYLLDGRGANMIQGSVSIDDEVAHNATLIIPGFHKIIRDWYSDIQTRGIKESKGLVYKLTPQHWTDEDRKKYETDFTPVPCHRGDARITLPSIAHGAQGTTEPCRRTLMPWYIRVNDDMQTLEVAEAGIWSQLAAAHAAFTPGPTSPSGHPNKYARIPYPFPASVHLDGLGHVSDALVCRSRWDNGAVLQDAKLLLFGSLDEVESYILNWRDNAKIQIKKRYNEMKNLEKDIFKESSFY